MAGITDQERLDREDQVEQALASVRMEGLEPSDAVKDIARRYADGQLTLEQMGEQIREWNAREFGPVHVSRD